MNAGIKNRAKNKLKRIFKKSMKNYMGFESKICKLNFKINFSFD